MKNKKTNLTVKDIANSLGISFSTVAKALNNDPVVSEITRDLVQKRAAEMGYFPNLLASGLRGKFTQSIGIILNDLENPTRTYIIRHIITEMVRYGFTSFVFDSFYDEEMERRNIINLLSRMPDAVIISPVSKNNKNLSLLGGLFDRTIVIGENLRKFPVSSIHMDHKKGAYISALHMLSNGHTRNLIIVEPPDYPSTIHFLAGVEKAYKESGIPIRDSHIIYDYPSIENSMNSILRLYDNERKKFNIPFTGVIASGDIAAVGVYRAANQIGINIPEDLSVIGYDDGPLARLVAPPMTTLLYPKEIIVEKCIDILKNILIQRETTIRRFSLSPKLIVRESIRKINSN